MADDTSLNMEEMRDVRGAQRTESLFLETIQTSSKRSYKPVWSLRDYDRKGLPSAYKVYMGSVDEADAAMKIVGSMSHWRKLCGLRWFMEGRVGTGFEGINTWRKDMADRDKTSAKKVIMARCEDGDVPAAKALDKLARESVKTPKIKNKKEEVSKADEDNVTNFLDVLNNGKQ